MWRFRLAQSLTRTFSEYLPLPINSDLTVCDKDSLRLSLCPEAMILKSRNANLEQAKNLWVFAFKYLSWRFRAAVRSSKLSSYSLRHSSVQYSEARLRSEICFCFFSTSLQFQLVYPNPNFIEQRSHWTHEEGKKKLKTRLLGPALRDSRSVVWVETKWTQTLRVILTHGHLETQTRVGSRWRQWPKCNDMDFR